MSRTLSHVVLALLASSALAACANSDGDASECFDTIDNDGDGYFDAADPACIAGEGVEARDPRQPDCSDMRDNDGDGRLDYPSDPGCQGPQDDDEFNDDVPRCRDGIDNDGDGKTDFPDDPGCVIDLQDDERDDCPDGPLCPACGNGVDDDGDGAADYPADNGCDTASDQYEEAADPGDCGGDIEPAALPADGVAMGSAIAHSTNNLISPQCGGAGQESVFVLQLDEARTLRMSTDFAETTLDTVVYIRSECRGVASELACDDDGGDIKPSASNVQVRVDPGTYYIVVDGFSAGSGGAFKLLVEQFLAPQDECDPENNDCPPGTVCRFLDTEATVETCELPACMDGIDSDGDTIVDFPDEPGCTAADDPDESDTCPDAGCPICANGADDDGDELIDYSGGDPGCDFAGDDNELDECVPGLLTSLLDDPVESGTLSGTSLLQATCGGANGPEDAWMYPVDRALRSLTFTTQGSSADTILYLYRDTCGVADLACQDGFPSETLTLQNPPLGDYFAIVDSWSGGAYVLGLNGVIAGGEACDPGEANFVCEAGYLCDGTVCAPTACNDGTDNDGDAVFDYPHDPGCSSVTDDDELDACPNGPGCPACSNDLDDDGDDAVDYGVDPGCEAAGDTNEIDNCVPGLSVGSLTPTSGVVDSTSGTSALSGSCGSSFGPEKAYVLTIDRDLESLTFSTAGSLNETILYVYYGTCGVVSSEIDCLSFFNQPEIITIQDPAEGEYFAVVDGFDSGEFTLSASGVISPGEVCDPADAQFVCSSGFACVGEVCVPSLCNDGDDNDGDGKTDYPIDPGCATPSDNSETDTCPGAGCPACGNGLDDDGDSFADYPADIGCFAAGDPAEVDCDGEQDLVSLLTTGQVTGTTTGLHNDFQPNCAGGSAPDKVYVLQVPSALESLHIDTNDSVLDTVVAVKTPDCSAADLACNDEGGVEFGSSKIELVDVQPGSYRIIVDGWAGGSGAYTLNVHGVINGGGACDLATINSGLFACDDGFACVGGTCSAAACNDTVDQDGDGLVGWPSDPGCSSVSDPTEVDTCPGGADCPACSNDADDDGDGFFDWGGDPGCQAAGDDDEIDECVPGLPTVTITTPTVSGTTSGAGLVSGTCGGGNAPEDSYRLPIDRVLKQLTLSTQGSPLDTVLYVRLGSCAGPQLSCLDGIPNETMVMNNPVLGDYFIIVDGYFSSGNYTLAISGVVAAGESCDAAETNFPCEAGYACNAGICSVALCNNGQDDDGDALPDELDPGCFDDSDGTEGPDPVPLPQCADGLDNDADTDIDYPADNGCERASDDLELPCTDPDLASLIDDVATGTTVGGANNSVGSCSWEGGAPDDVWMVEFPGTLTSLNANTSGTGFDTVLYIHAAECGGTSMGCNDDSAGTLQSAVNLSNVAPGLYFIVVDGYSAGSGPYTLHVTGVVAPGQACDQAQIDAGIVTCGGATACNAGVCN